MAVDHTGREAFRLAVARREAPRTLLVAGGAFALVTVLNSLVGPAMPQHVLVVNLVAAGMLIVAGMAIRADRIRSSAVPWITAVGALMLVSIGQVQVWWSPDAVGYFYVLLLMVLYPFLTMAWAPALTVAVPMLCGSVVVASGRFPDQSGDWIIASVAVLSTGMALLWLRLSSVDELADTSALVAAFATRDTLTGVYNRHGIEEHLPELVSLADRNGQQVFAMFADVDGLKAVNDAHGHARGDAVLVATAEAIRSAVRASDLVCRWGGDEFIVLGLGRGEHPDDLGARIHAAVGATAIDPGTWPGRVSVGMATEGLADLNFEVLIRRADADMYARRRLRRAGDPDPDEAPGSPEE